MNRRFIIQTLGISLVILLAPFFINKALASQASASIGFNINKSISEANYLQFKIKAAEHYRVTVWLEDGDGETIKITFSSQDDYTQGDYELDEEEDYLPLVRQKCWSQYFRRPFTNNEGNENSIPADLTSVFGENNGIAPFNSPQADCTLSPFVLHSRPQPTGWL